jgi:hypothetical protein
LSAAAAEASWQRQGWAKLLLSRTSPLDEGVRWCCMCCVDLSLGQNDVMMLSVSDPHAPSTWTQCTCYGAASRRSPPSCSPGGSPVDPR